MEGNAGMNVSDFVVAGREDHQGHAQADDAELFGAARRYASG
jgi:hypothetical protein